MRSAARDLCHVCISCGLFFLPCRCEFRSFVIALACTQGGTVVNSDGQFKADVLVEGDKIAGVGTIKVRKICRFTLFKT